MARYRTLYLKLETNVGQLYFLKVNGPKKAIFFFKEKGKLHMNEENVLNVQGKRRKQVFIFYATTNYALRKENVESR